MRQSILVDIDGVACDHAKSICNWVNDEYNLKTTPSDVCSWNHDFGPITFVEAVKKCYPDENFILSMEVSRGFMNFYHTLKGKIDITFATARTESKDATKAWVSTFFPHEKVVFTPQKSLIANHQFLIDDYHQECIRGAESGMHCILIRRPWNSGADIAMEIAKYKNISYCSSFLDAVSAMNIEI